MEESSSVVEDRTHIQEERLQSEGWVSPLVLAARRGDKVEMGKDLLESTEE